MQLSGRVVQIITDIKLHKEVTLVIIMLSGQSDMCLYMFAFVCQWRQGQNKTKNKTLRFVRVRVAFVNACWD